MTSTRFTAALAAAVIALGLTAVRAGQQQPPSSAPLSGAPLGLRGEAIYPAVEGWGPHKDGASVILVGYYNRNREQTIDVPIGPNNRIEPGGPDYGQPTHFEPGRHWGVFAIQTPKDFGTTKLTWTLIANGQTTRVVLWLNPKYWIDFFNHAASGNTPPVIRFSPEGPALVGPPRGIAQTLTTTVGAPVTLKLWASDKADTIADSTEELVAAARGRAAAADAARGRGAGTDAARGRAAGGGGRGDAARGADPAQNFDLSAAAGRAAAAGRGGRGGGAVADVSVAWKLHRAPGAVKLADETIRLQNKGDVNAVMEATTTATFSAPGEYWMRAQVNDRSGEGGGGDQCCWTNAHVKVIVKGK